MVHGIREKYFRTPKSSIFVDIRHHGCASLLKVLDYSMTLMFHNKSAMSIFEYQSAIGVTIIVRSECQIIPRITS